MIVLPSFTRNFVLWRTLLAIWTLLLTTTTKQLSTAFKATTTTTTLTDIPIYWINMDSNKDRRISMRDHLEDVGVRYHRRIPALTPETCNLLMVESPCFRVGLIDIAILCSHLQALYIALHDKHPDAKDSPYFMILEDDVRFKYKIQNYQDFIRYIPVVDGRPFTSIQLMMSHKVQIEEAWKSYLSSLPSTTTSSSGSSGSTTNTRKYFSIRPRNSTIWSAQAILYRKEGLRQFIEKAIVRDRQGNLGFKLVNSFDYSKHSPYKINAFKPSIACDCLFADSFLYAMAQPSFILNIPMMYSCLTGRNSSLHQSHVVYHAQGFALIEHIQSMLDASEDTKYAHLFPEELLSRYAILGNDNERNEKSLIRNWTQIALANPVSGKGIPKNFNFVPGSL